jgi:hypothetical protein
LIFHTRSASQPMPPIAPVEFPPLPPLPFEDIILSKEDKIKLEE